MFIIRFDETFVPQIPVSAFVPKYGCYMGWPSIVSRSGVDSIVPIQLLPEEELCVARCGKIIKEATENVLKDMK